MSHVIQVDEVDVLDLLASASLPKFYFSDRSRRESVGALGIVSEYRLEAGATKADIGRMLDRATYDLAPDQRLYGGLRFDPVATPSSEWATFGAARFFLPRLEIRQRSTGAHVRLNYHAGNVSDLDAAIRVIDEVLDSSSISGSYEVDLDSRVDAPGYLEWTEAVDQTLEVIRSGRFEKAVLARAVRYMAVQGCNPLVLFDRVRSGAPHCYHLYYQPTDDAAFMSATPERLFKLCGSDVLSEAVAGTRPRGEATADDVRLLDELLTSDKDRREHAVVGRCIVEALTPLCENVSLDKTPTEMRLRGNRHLKSMVRATIRPGTTSGQLLEALHPTPAVGGYPTDEALETLAEVEPFDRGWYAGAMGWIGRDEAELTVAIRSALALPDSLTLYSGAGIVEGSEADSEWSEIEQKIDNFMNVIAATAEWDETPIRG
jgi:menaquinone-specific isochorismate synthase